MSGRRFQQVEEYLVEVYRMSLRALDDVKETVRTLCPTICIAPPSPHRGAPGGGSRRSTAHAHTGDENKRSSTDECSFNLLKHVILVYLKAFPGVVQVRTAGQALNRAVSGLCVKFADPSQSDAATADKVLGLILPLLLQEGIAQGAAEVRVASVQQLVKMTKHAGVSLAPHIPELAAVSCLL